MYLFFFYLIGLFPWQKKTTPESVDQSIGVIPLWRNDSRGLVTQNIHVFYPSFHRSLC